MSFASHLRCMGCAAQYPPDRLLNLCPVDSRPLEIIIDLERLMAARPDQGWLDRDRRDMWRYGGLLPLDITDPADARHVVTLGEGWTPVLPYRDHPLARKARFALGVKDEGKAHRGFGANPTQSFKDRGMSVTVSMARKFGLDRLAIPTQGNAGDSLCEYVNAAGMSAIIAMPENTPLPILGRVALLARQSERIRLETVTGTIREADECLKSEWLSGDCFSVATFQEPGWRIDGKKTMGLELAEPGRAGDTWELPDVVIYPTGGGTGVLGMWKAWSELECMGLLDDRRPKMVCVQFEGTAPLVRAMDAGAADTRPTAAGKTLAYGINVPGGVGHFRVLEIVRASGGAAVAVSEAEIHASLAAVWKHKGWWICPEGAACLAALPRLLDRGLISAGDRVIAFNTGSLEKYLPELRALL